jgi:hypothetical protein
MFEAKRWTLDLEKLLTNYDQIGVNLLPGIGFLIYSALKTSEIRQASVIVIHIYDNNSCRR